jgi:hypothetical protein
VVFPLGLPRQKRVNVLRLQYGLNPTGINPINRQQAPLTVALSEEVTGASWRVDSQIAVLTVIPEDTPEHEIWGGAPERGVGLAALIQAGLALRPDGEEGGVEQVITASRRPSLVPVLIADDDANLHVAWLETGGFGQYRVVYASNAPAVRQVYNALTLWDVIDITLSGVLQFFSILWIAFPVLFLWSLAAFVVLVLYHIVTGEEDLRTTRSRVVLGAVLAAEVVLTVLFPPSVAVAWSPWYWFALFATVILAAVVILRVLRRRVDSWLFTVFFVFTAIHIILRLILYTLLSGAG